MKLSAIDKYDLSLTALFVAVEAGELTEMQAAQMANMDVVTLRGYRRALLHLAQENWEKHRQINPPMAQAVAVLAEREE